MGLKYKRAWEIIDQGYHRALWMVACIPRSADLRVDPGSICPRGSHENISLPSVTKNNRVFFDIEYIFILVFSSNQK